MRFFRGVTTYAVGNVFVQFIHFLLIPIYVQSLTVPQFGTLVSLEVVFFISNILFSLSLERSAQRFYFEKGDYFGEKVFSSVFFMMAAVSGAVLILTSLGMFRGLLESQIGVAFFPGIFCVFISSSFYGLTLVAQTKMQVMERISSFTLFQVLKGVLLVASTYYFIVQRQNGVVGYAYSLLFTYGMLFLVSVWIVRPSFRGAIIPLNVAREILLFAIPYIPTLVSAWIFAMSGRIILNNYGSQEDVALYSMAFKISAGSLLATSSVLSYVTPRIYDGLSKTPSDFESVEKMCRASEFVFTCLFMVAFVFVEDVYAYALTKEYMSSLPYVLPMILVNYMSAIMGVSANLFFSFYKMNLQLMIIYVIAAFSYVFLSVLLVDSYSIWGITGAAAIVTFLLALGQSLYLRMRGVWKMDVRALIFSSLFMIAFGYVAMAVNGYLLQRYSYSWTFIKIGVLVPLLCFVYSRVKALEV